MREGNSVCVVVPAYDEAPRIGSTLGTLPAFVDAVVVVDDGSTDGTAEIARTTGDPRVTVIEHPVNRGVGCAIATGYAWALERGYDATVVIGADGQMDPADMRPLVDAVLGLGDGPHADYVKGNRLLRLDGWASMPFTRLCGTLALSLGTMLATGIYHSFDSQCGYTVISRKALAALPLERLFPRYGYPNDLLVHLARAGCRVRDIPVRAVYGPGTSKMKVRRVILPLLGIIGRGVVGRVGLG